MRKMKKILAWLTVLTVNVSMMPMPTVAAATATDASTALNEETRWNAYNRERKASLSCLFFGRVKILWYICLLFRDRLGCSFSHYC